MNKVFKYLFASALLFTTLFNVANAQLTDAEKALINKSVILDKKTSTGPVEGSYYLNLETFITGYTSNVTTVTTTTTSTPLDIVLLLDVSGSMEYGMSTNTAVSKPNRRIDALQTAVNNFISTINTDAKTNNVKHQISLIKFAMNAYPSGTTQSSKTSYYPMNSAAYSYNGYGTNSYYYKDGDNYYVVNRETGTGSTIYTARNSASYTYNGYGSNSYYYLYNGNYYKVERYSDNSGYYLRFQVNNQYYYLSNTTVTTTKTGNSRNNRTIWTGVLYTQSNATVYRLYYQDASNVKHYLSGTSTTTTAPTNVENAGTTIWTGSLYIAETASTPDNIILGNDTYRYSSSLTKANYTQVVANFTEVNDSGSQTLQGYVNNLNPGGATAADFGMELTKLVFQSSRSDAIKVLILFTDGAPTYNRDFQDDVANSVIKSSKVLKDAGVKVYTIATISGVTDGSDVDKYLKYTSSNYPDAQSLSTSGDNKATTFAFNTTSASELDNVFQRISQETSQAASNANAGYTEATTENNVTIKDIVTSNFVIPSDAYGNIDLSKIEIYTAKSTGVTRVDGFDYQNYEYTEDGYSWAEPVPSDLEPVASRDSENGKTTVSVPGFNFSEKWVGWQDSYDVNGSTTTRKDDECILHDGYKLIIKILVEPDPNGVGGLVPTNEKESGLYITKDGKEISLKSYDVPGSVLVPMDLNIVMNGIKDRGDYNLYKPGETAIFKITDYEGKSWTVAVTADESGVGRASIKVPFYNDETKDTYKVEEMPEWSYRFNSKADPDITGNQANSTSITKKLTSEDHTFYFVATDTEVRDNGDQVSSDFKIFFYDEANKNNVFNSSANPTGTSTTSKKN